MTRHGPAARRTAAALLALAVYSATVAAQQPARPPLDPLAEATARQKIADQKAEREVIDAIADADRQARINPVKAVQLLKTARVNIENTITLSADAKKKLMAAIDDKIALIGGKAPANANPQVKLDPKGAEVKFDKKVAYESMVAEVKAVTEGIDRYAKFKQAGLNKEADQELARLAAAYPNNPSIVRLTETDYFGDRVKEAVAFRDLQQKRINQAFDSVDRSSLPIGGNGDVEFPKDWKEKTERRLKTIDLTEAEKKIIEALNKPVTVNWNNMPLDEALQDLSNSLDQKLFLDKKSIEDLGIDLRKGVTMQTNRISARTVLRQVLAAQGLTFVVKDQVIQVVDVERARKMLVTRVYYLGDVVQGVGPFGGAPQWGQFLDFQQTMANVDTIVKTITTSIDPLSWKEAGGPGSVTFHFPSMSIIVRASAEVHAALGSKMGGGR